jgi:hypothetical protein
LIVNLSDYGIAEASDYDVWKTHVGPRRSSDAVAIGHLGVSRNDSDPAFPNLPFSLLGGVWPSRLLF